ncbi:molecular chaperone DnaJ [Pseudorhizobium endolithicum]|uniref:Molecular chaperone DnaJ n=2 Tax=Pseudorhizobium endolithicum TaxID=1191678 RepID=A0ABN7JH90_9HYPH|nr:molecular chaperone DnaJ [Pseudorhizobium endolithicum]
MEELGLPDAEGKRGKLVVELRVMLWEKPDAKVTDLMRHMREGLYI